FKLEEQQIPKLVTEVFQKLARVHAMDVPIKRTHWFFTEMDRFYGLAQNNLNIHINNNEYNLETFKKYDLKTELEFIQQLLVKSKSPMVFTHNDFRSSNIMVLEDNNNNNNDLSDGQVVLCDFEYSSYGFRGHDMGIILSEWGRSISDFAKPYTFPDDSVLLSLIDIYIKESQICEVAYKGYWHIKDQLKEQHFFDNL
ncbi:unnamed protein product, partial [Oppiella nova]